VALRYFELTLGSEFEYKSVSAKQGDFGDLEGVQFDSDHCGGLLYFWSSGSIQCHLYDYKLDVEVILNSLEPMGTDEAIRMFVNSFIQKVKDVEAQ
jgi:hypothetical protein